jgi:hypothetical protein
VHGAPALTFTLAYEATKNPYGIKKMLNGKSIIAGVLLMQCFVSPVMAESGYIAKSHCSLTGATGFGAGTTREEAVAGAIEKCIDQGGVPKCCASGAGKAVRAFAATAYCSATGKGGTGIAERQDDANELAVSNCIGNGGIPHCCRAGLSN